MIQEDKQLLLIELCARFPYGVKIYRALYEDVNLTPRDIESFIKGYDDILMPYLRPMSSMTEEEKKELNNVLEYQYYADDSCMCEASDWLNAHHFDYRGLIPKGLAISTEEFNPYKD